MQCFNSRGGDEGQCDGGSAAGNAQGGELDDWPGGLKDDSDLLGANVGLLDGVAVQDDGCEQYGQACAGQG